MSLKTEVVITRKAENGDLFYVADVAGEAGIKAARLEAFADGFIHAIDADIKDSSIFFPSSTVLPHLSALLSTLEKKTPSFRIMFNENYPEAMRHIAKNQASRIDDDEFENLVSSLAIQLNRSRHSSYIETVEKDYPHA